MNEIYEYETPEPIDLGASSYETPAIPVCDIVSCSILLKNIDTESTITVRFILTGMDDIYFEPVFSQNGFDDSFAAISVPQVILGAFDGEGYITDDLDGFFQIRVDGDGENDNVGLAIKVYDMTPSTATALDALTTQLETLAEKFHFAGDRVLSLSPPTAAVVDSDNVFMFNLISEADDPLVTGGSDVDDAPGVLTDDQWKVTHVVTEPSTHTQWKVSVDVTSHDSAYAEEIGDPPIALSSSNELVATVDVSGEVHYVSDGTCLIVGVSEAIGTSPSQRAEVEIVNTTATPDEYTYYEYVDDPGSVREDASAAVDDRIAVGGVEKNIFSTQDHATPNYIRNANCWAADLDLTCISPWNSYSSYLRAGTLISPRHIIYANHFSIPNGTTIRFVDSENYVVTRTLISSLRVGATDLRVGVLDVDVTECTFAKILPGDDWADYIPNNGYKIPALVLDQEEKALVDEVMYITGINNATGFKIPADATRKLFYESIIGGDSGNPSFLIINNQLVILTVWHYGLAGSGDSIVYNKSGIESAMTSLGGGYTTLTEIDLSSFNNYGV
jgi:hypothetical protein